MKRNYEPSIKNLLDRPNDSTNLSYINHFDKFREKNNQHNQGYLNSPQKFKNNQYKYSANQNNSLFSHLGENILGLKFTFDNKKPGNGIQYPKKEFWKSNPNILQKKTEKIPVNLNFSLDVNKNFSDLFKENIVKDSNILGQFSPQPPNHKLNLTNIIPESNNNNSYIRNNFNDKENDLSINNISTDTKELYYHDYLKINNLTELMKNFYLLDSIITLDLVRI